MILEAEEGFAVGTAFPDEALLDLDYRAYHAGTQMALLASRHKAHGGLVAMVVSVSCQSVGMIGIMLGDF